MPVNLRRNLNLCFTKIKSSSPTSRSSPNLRGGHGGRHQSTSSAASVLTKNFNSLYDAHSKSFICSDDHPFSSSESDPEDTATTPDLATVFASQRFFFSSPGRSNSIVDSSSLSSLASTSLASPGNQPEPNRSFVGGSIVVPTFSPDPFLDFRRSMQEMVDAHDLIDVGDNWDYLHQLLACYLSLNPKSTHKFIVRAFADLLVSLMVASSSSSSEIGRQTNISEGGNSASSFARRWMKSNICPREQVWL